MRIALIALSTMLLVAPAPGYSASASMRRELTPEERLVYMQEERGAHWRALSLQQRCARRQQMHAQWASMNPADLQKLKQQLDARWNAMPAAERQRIEQRIADRRTRPARSSGRDRHSPCASHAAP
jgi:hypothetical protein